MFEMETLQKWLYENRAVKQINKHCDSDSDVVITISKKS